MIEYRVWGRSGKRQITCDPTSRETAHSSLGIRRIFYCCRTQNVDVHHNNETRLRIYKTADKETVYNEGRLLFVPGNISSTLR